MSAAAFSVHRPPIPMVPNIPVEDISQTIIHNTWTTTGQNAQTHKSKYEVPVCHVNDVELLLHVIHEFRDASHATRLHLTTGPERFAKFRECLRGTPRDRWDTVVAARGNDTTTTAHFDEAIEALLATYLDNSSLQIQEEYLLTQYKKKYSDDNFKSRHDSRKHLCFNRQHPHRSFRTKHDPSVQDCDR